MKTQLSNIALEGTHGRKVMSGLLSWTEGKPSGAFVWKGGYRPGKERAARKKEKFEMGIPVKAALNTTFTNWGVKVMAESNMASIDKSRQEKPIKPIDPITVKKVNLIGDILIRWGEDTILRHLSIQILRRLVISFGISGKNLRTPQVKRFINVGAL